MSINRPAPAPGERRSTHGQAGDSPQARIAAWVRRLAPNRATLRGDAVAGLSGAISSVPDGMAGSVLVGVNPVFGLYASAFGPMAGGLLASTQLMVVTTTTASALAASGFLAGLSPETRDASLFLLVMLAGAVALAAGLLRLGRFTAFVSHSVMIGFLSGIAVLVILGQLPDVTGIEAEGPNKVAQAIDILFRLGEADLQTVAVSVLTLVLAVGLVRTPIGAFGTLVALVIPSVLVLVAGWDGVDIVNDVGEIPRGLPSPQLPDVSLVTADMVTVAIALAVIVLVQGAGVSQSVPNQDGTRSNPNGDFVAQGVANLVGGLFRGIPVGGSVGQTAINVVAGARTRWAAILAGVWMLVFLTLIPGLVGLVAMPSLAALLILAGIQTIRLPEALSIWETGWEPRIAILATFVATLFLPIQAAVGLGAVLSALFYLNRSATDVKLVELRRLESGRFEEHKPHRRLQPDQVTVLMVYGSLFYAGARTLEDELPTPRGDGRSAVVLTLRGRTLAGATLIDVLDRYAEKLASTGGRLYVSGVSRKVHSQMKRTGKLELGKSVFIFAATPVIGEATDRAVEHATAWLATGD